MNNKQKNWVIDNSYYNSEVVTCNVFCLEINKNRKIYLIDKAPFTYTFSCGANSEYSFTGSFFKKNVKTVEEAKQWLEKFADAWFSDNQTKVRELDNSILL